MIYASFSSHTTSTLVELYLPVNLARPDADFAKFVWLADYIRLEINEAGLASSSYLSRSC